MTAIIIIILFTITTSTAVITFNCGSHVHVTPSYDPLLIILIVRPMVRLLTLWGISLMVVFDARVIGTLSSMGETICGAHVLVLLNGATDGDGLGEDCVTVLI